MCGYDADCNGATVGSILGVLHGEKAIPEKWKTPLNNTIYTSLRCMHKVNITHMAEKSLDLAVDMLMHDYPIARIAKNELQQAKPITYYYELSHY